MRGTLSTLVVCGLFVGMAVASQAGDDAGAIIDKAIAAHGIKGKEDKTPAYRGKNKGTLHVAGMDLEFTQEVIVQVPNKFKEVMEMTVMGNKVSIAT
ncbi:MAG TPA: hypothetical protein VGZ47_12975, partial [Gemmataceae bacterium]|nr:hypothetical protein [Gemmataceae bacterium]